MYVREEEQIEGMTRLLIIGLRVLSLFELVLRGRLEERGEKLRGWYTGQAKRETSRPTAARTLRAVARMEITATCAVVDGFEQWHLSALPPLLRQILELVGLPASLYTQFATLNSE